MSQLLGGLVTVFLSHHSLVHCSHKGTRQMNGEWQTVSVPTKKRTCRQQQLPEWFQELEPPHQIPFQPFMLLLMGLPGSGKSTIAEKLQELESWKYVRVNQDTLGDRHSCLKLAKRALDENKCPIIDRCHASLTNRRPFYELAKSCNVPVDVLIVNAPHSVCLERCQRRHDHPTVSSNDAKKVLAFVRKEWKLPNENEEHIRHFWTISGIDDPQFPDVFQHSLL